MLCVVTLVAVAQAGYLGGGYAGYAAPVAYTAPTYAAPAIVKAPLAYKAAAPAAVDYYVSTTVSFFMTNRNSLTRGVAQRYDAHAHTHAYICTHPWNQFT